MRNWATGLTILSAAFVGTVGVTMALAAVVVPRAFSHVPDVEPTASGGITAAATPPPVDQIPDAIGGVLTVTGDVEGSFTLDREAAEIGFQFDEATGAARLVDGPYELGGEDGRISFAVEPLTVEQIDYAGLSFYPDAGDCEIAPGALNSALGVASASLRCEDIADIRDNGVITLDGTIHAAADLLGLRGELPASGGTIEVGSETLELAEARAPIEPFGFDAATGLASLPILNEGMTEGVILSYDPHTHELDVESIIVNEESIEAPEACSVARSDIGLLNPRTAVAELAISCDALDVPGLGSVPVTGSLVVDLIGEDAPP